MDNPTLKALGRKALKFAKDKGIPIPKVPQIVLFVMGILCGRATLFSLLRPFGGAFFAAAFSGRFSYTYMLAAILGQALSFAPLYETGKYMLENY